MGMVTIPTALCPVCKKPELAEVNVDADEYWRWLFTADTIQIAMPNTPAPVREQLMTGIHPECWKTIASEEES